MKLLGIDFGEARIGLALSDDLGMLAHPLGTLNGREKTSELLAQIVAIVQKEKVQSIIIGLPRNMNGTYGPAAEKVRAFGAALQEISPVPTLFWDERMTTQQAQRSLHEAGRNTKNSRQIIDQVAAVIILQSYLDAHSPP